MRAAAALLLVLVAVAPAAAQLDLDRLLRGLSRPPDGGLGDVKIGQALKEALQIGTANAVSLTGRVDGYFANQAIKILMPSQLKTLETGLRAVGFGDRVDEFVLGMNRAAEQAAPAAKQIFWDAIGEMTIDDTRGILGGGDTAATDYFKGKTTDKLTTAFRPIVQSKLDTVGVTHQYRQLLAQARAIPFFRTESYDIDTYVVDKALDGLFHVVGEEERKIRTNPQARVTELLRQVFGSAR